jgi:hypothetical protein
MENIASISIAEGVLEMVSFNEQRAKEIRIGLESNIVSEDSFRLGEYGYPTYSELMKLQRKEETPYIARNYHLEILVPFTTKAGDRLNYHFFCREF